MRIVMMGTGPFAVPTFQALLAAGHDIPLLVTRPPVPTKGKPPINPMREVATAHGIPVFDPPSINTAEAINTVQSLAADLLVVCDYGQILSPAALATTRWGGINLHGSLLPKYRGAAPVQWCVYHGDPVSGVSVILLTPKLDGGPVLVQTSVDVDPAETAGELETRLSQIGVEAVLQALLQLEQWDLAQDPTNPTNGPGSSPPVLGIPQAAELVTKAPRLHKSQGQIDWTRSAADLRNQIRAFQPWPGSYTHWQRGSGPPLRLIIAAAQVVPAPTDPPSPASAGSPAAPGTLVRADHEQLWVQTGDGVLSLTQIQPAGKRVMSIAEFLRGYAPAPGQAFAWLDPA